MTMTVEDLIAWGRSLVFVPTIDEGRRVEGMCIRRGVPYVNSSNGVDPHTNLKVFENLHNGLKHACLIAVLPAFTVGVRIYAHRVIWIGDVPQGHGDQRFATFVQAMHRVPTTWEHFDPQGMTVRVETRPFVFPVGHA
jgi:hypothetical protein